ncbi:hypothetical protein PTTG_30071, partial [Puccinia triticina 1-1 BBBD Race 1]
MSSNAEPETWSHPALKYSRIEQLKAPGPDSNYLEWTWFMRSHLNTTDILYVVEGDEAAAKAKPNWVRDNKVAFGVISQTIHPAHVRHVRHITDDARTLWATIRRIHQDSSAGGKMYYLQKLSSHTFLGDDLPAHLDEMAKLFEGLSSLVTKENPLTLEDIYSISILKSLPADWLSCCLAMLNDPSIPPSKLIDALKAEHLRRKTRGEQQALVESVARASLSQPNSARPSRPPPDHSLYCNFCKRSGHNLEICENAARILADHD